MSLANENMEQLFAAAKGLPGELSLREVELTFLNPAPLPPAKPWHGGYLKFFTMLSFLLATVLAVMLTGPTERPLTTNLPNDETTISLQETLVVPNQDVLETAPQPPFMAILTTASPALGQVPQLPTLALQPVIAPAAAPPNISTPTHLRITATNSSIPPTTTSADSRTYTDLPVPIFSGHWKLRKSVLQLSILEITSNQQEQHLFLATSLTKAELRDATNREAIGGKIERATGTIILRGGKKRGTFEFVPNASFRDRLNAIGLGDHELPDGENPRIPVLPSLIEPGVCSDTDHPRELLWLKYFVSNVNDNYLKVLYDHGYTDSELVGLYHLPDYAVKRLTLINLLNLTDQLFAERVPIKDLAPMSWRITYLNALIRSGNSGMTLEAFQNRADNALLGSGISSGSDPLTSSLIGVLGNPLADVDQPLIGRLVTPASLFAGSETQVSGMPMLDFDLPDNWGTGSPGRTAEPLNVSAFSKLVVKGNIRLFLNYSDAPQQLVVFATAAARSALSVKQSGNKITLKNAHSSELIDIEVSGPFLEGIRTSGNALFIKKSKTEE